MADYTIRLETFEGPLALLMHLIEKHQLDIYDIPIAEVTGQYLDYLAAMEEFNIEIASEFLVMAATLLQIKSRLLLPRPVTGEAAADEVDPRLELVERLVEYRKFKQLSAVLSQLSEERDKYFTRLPQEFTQQFSLPAGLSLHDLLKAFAALWESAVPDFAVIAPEEISVKDKMYDIMTLLRSNKGQLEFNKTIFRTGSRTEAIAAFLALLELIRLKQVSVCQKQPFAPIHLKLEE